MGERAFTYKNKKDAQDVAQEVGYDNNTTMLSLMENPDVEEFTILPEDLYSQKYTISNNLNIIKIVYMHMQGYSSASIADTLGCSTEHINTIKRSEEFREALKVIASEVISTARVFLSASSIKAVRTLIQLMNSSDERIQLNAAIEVLNRAGLKSPEKFEITTTNKGMGDMSEEELLTMVQNGMSEIIRKKEAIEVTPVEGGGQDGTKC